MARHRTKHHKPIERKPDAEFWMLVRANRYDMEVARQSSMYESFGALSESPQGVNYTAQPMGIPLGDGCFRGKTGL